MNCRLHLATHSEPNSQSFDHSSSRSEPNFQIWDHSSSPSELNFQFCDHSSSRSEPTPQVCHPNHRMVSVNFVLFILLFSVINRQLTHRETA